MRQEYDLHLFFYSTAQNAELLGIIPMLDPPRHDTATTISRALDLGVVVKMLTGGKPVAGTAVDSGFFSDVLVMNEKRVYRSFNGKAFTDLGLRIFQ